MKDPDRISIVKSAGVFAVFAWLWLVTALGTLALTWGTPVDPAVPPGAYVITMVMGAGIGIVALGVALARLGVDIDRRRRTASRWFGPLFPLFARTEPLERFDRVLLSKDVRHDRSGRCEVYVVQLAGPDVVPLVVEESKDPIAARARAEEVGRLLALAIQDDTGPTPVTRPPGTFDDSLRTRVRRGDVRPARVERPAAARTIVTPLGGELRLEIPPAGFRWFQVAILTAVAVLTLGATWLVVTTAGREDVVPALVAVGLGGALNFLIPFVYFWSRARARQTIVARRAGLDVRDIGLLWSRTAAMPADELEELEIELGTHARLVARSDRASLHLGRGLAVAELEWLRSELCDTLAS